MSKGLFYGLLLIALAAMCSCTKRNDSSSSIKVEDGWIRVLGVKHSTSDTSSTKYVHARVETVGLLVVEDSRLRAELVAYQPLAGGMGKFVIRVTNKQSCQMILRWNWDNINPTSIEPDDTTAGTIQSDVIKGNAVKTYIVIGKATLGRIYVQAQKSNDSCPNSSQLILEITQTILPIEFTTFTVDKKDGNYNIKFHTETPQEVDDFYIMWTPDGNPAHETVRGTIQSDGSTKDYKISIPIPTKYANETSINRSRNITGFSNYDLMRFNPQWSRL